MDGCLTTPIMVEFLEDSSAIIMCRIEDRPTAPNSRGTPLLKADVASAVLYVHDITDAANITQVISPVTLTVADVVFDTLFGWSKDSIGGNFRYIVPPEAFPCGDHKYRVTVKFVDVSGFVNHTQWQGKALEIDAS